MRAVHGLRGHWASVAPVHAGVKRSRGGGVAYGAGMRRLGRTFRKGLVVGVVIGLAYALVRWLRTAPPGVAPLDAEPAPAARPEPTEAAWAAAPRVVPEPMPPTVAVDDEAPSPLAAVLDDMAAEAMVADDAAVDGRPVLPARPATAKKRATVVTKAAAKKQAPARKATAKKRTATKQAAARVAPTWVDPDGRTCPPSHPVKVKASSGIFHVPGGGAYDRTAPDRCYTDPAAAEADGHRAAKR